MLLSVTDKDKVALYFEEGNYLGHAITSYNSYIKVAKSLKDVKVYLNIKSPEGTEIVEEAKYYKELDDNYDIYIAKYDSTGVVEDCDVSGIFKVKSYSEKDKVIND